MATIRDVARESGVSIATVSRVFNHGSIVRRDTRDKVIAAAERLGYWPGAVAGKPVESRTHAVGVLLPAPYGEFFSELVHGIDLAARTLGLHLLVSRSTSTAVELGAALRLMRGRVDALVVVAPQPEAWAELRSGADPVPMVRLHGSDAPPDCDTIEVANHEGARAVVLHLATIGHRPIAMITGPRHSADARQRLDGFRSALREAGHEADPRLEVAGDFTESSGHEAATRLFARDPRPAAVFAANDYMAIGAMRAARGAGLRLPDDLAIAGFDDIPLARAVSPPLTTVSVDFRHMGRRAIELLAEAWRGGARPPSRHEVLPAALVVRGSCGAAVVAR